MCRFMKRKHAKNYDEVSVEIPQGHETSDDELQAHDQFHCISSSITGRKKICRYDESCLSIGFTWIKAVLFHCVSSVANDFQMQNGSS